MASQHEDSSESDGETEPTKCFHRRLSTNKDIRYNSFIKEGFLNKQNGSFQRWHKRYFKLKSGVLYYSKDKKSTIFNQIDLIDSSIAERSLKNINHSFQVITPFRNLVLCAATRSEMKGWVSALRAAASKDVREVTSEMAELSSLSDHHNWCVLPNIRPIFCNVCHESLHRVTRSGVTINGLACEVCKLRTHKKCASKSPSTCKWTTLASMGGNIVEDENGDLVMPHQWMMGNFPVSSKCLVCEKPCSSVLKLQDYWCLWCHCTVHTACKDQTVRCSLGPARVSILPPISITNFDEGGFWRASKSPNTSPLLVFLNSKSGDSQGVKMLRRFKQLLNPAQVFDLMNGGPKIGLRLFQNFESFRVLVCGGDGSVGWVLNEIDRLGLHKQCQVGVLPLGTGNDLSRVLGWGASFDDDTQLPALLEKLEHAQIQMFDRWSIYSYETDQTRNRSLTIDPICAYEDTASNHLSRILHSDSHNVVISSAMVLCSIVQELVSKVGQSFEETEVCPNDKDSFAYKCLTLNQKMEALLKTLAEESTIGQSEHEQQKSSPRLRSSSADRPVVILFDELPPPTLLLSSSSSPPPSSSSLSAPSSSSSAASTKTLVGNGVKDEIISVLTTPAREDDSSRIVTSFPVSSSSLSSSSPQHPQPSSSPSQPSSSSSSSFQGASTADTTCLLEIQSANACTHSLITSSSSPLSPSLSSPPISSSSSSSSPPISSSSSSHSTAPLLAPLSCYFPRSSLSSIHPSSVTQQPPSSSSSSSSAQTSTFSKSRPVPSAGQRSPRVQKGTVRSKEQLMCRANSLKKAIRQIVELTEKAVDEQNHQTNQFDKDNEMTMSDIISTTTLVASLLSSPDQTLADTLSVRRPSDDRGPFVIVTGDEGPHGACNGDLASPPLDPDLGNYVTHSTTLASSTIENLTPAKSPSREPTPIIFNYQLCDTLPYVDVGSSLTGVTCTLSKLSPRRSTTRDSPSPLVCSALTPIAPGSSQEFNFCSSSVSPTHVYPAMYSATVSSPIPTCDIPSVNVVDDSILDNEVSQVMHDVNGIEKNHLVVPGSHHYHHHHLISHHHHHHQYFLSPQQHHHHHHHHHHHVHHQTNRHHHHHQFKDPNTLIAQHHLHVYSSSDGEASRSSTPHSTQNCPLNLVDRWSPLFGMTADRMNSPSPYFFEHQTDGKLSHNVSPSKACSSHSGSGRHLSSLSTLYRAPDNPPVAQSGLRHSQKSPEGIQFPLLNVPLLQSLPKQVIGKGRKSSPIHSSLISRALMANADALCAPASPLNDLANINLDDFTEKCVMNNYFGIGLDAKIALDFHNKREEHPKKCRSRTKNMMWYGVLGGKEILQRTHKNLDQKVRLECDGKLIPLPNLQGIVILNIPSYMGGTNFWGGSKEDEYFIAPSFDDKVLEVVAVFGSIQLGISRVINIQRHRIAQCHTVRITIIGDEGLPVQVDGEAWIQNPGVVWIQHKNRAQVLIRDRAFEEALKIWTEKQKLERTTPREPPLSESELATLTTFTDASRDLFEKVTRELELSPPAQALNFVDSYAVKTSTISTDGKVLPRISRGEVMEFASHVRSFCYEVRRAGLHSQLTKEVDDDRLRNVLEFLEDNMDKVHNMGAQFYERHRNKDRLKLLFKLPKSSRKHRDGAMESLKPEVLTIRDWTHVDVAQWLNALDLGEYAEVFVAHDIRGTELLTLGRTDLKELGIVKVGHLKRLLQEIKSIKEHLKSIEGHRVRNISEDSTTASSRPVPVQVPASPLLLSPSRQQAMGIVAVEGGDSGGPTPPEAIATSSSSSTSTCPFVVEQANSTSSSSSSA